MAGFSLTTHAARQRLKPRGAPYFVELSEGCYLGFRRGADTWCARFRDRQGEQHHKKFKGLPGIEEGKKYDVAKGLAEEWFDAMGGAKTPQRGSVRDGCNTYLKRLELAGRSEAAGTAKRKFKASVFDDDEFADLLMEDLVNDDVLEWRARLKKRRDLSNPTVNRYVGNFVAAMNVAVVNGHPGNPLAWKVEDLPETDTTETGDTSEFIDDTQADRLLRNSTPEGRDFYDSIRRSGGRPQELAAANVGDYDAVTNTLVLKHMKGRPAKLRARLVALHPRHAEFFKRVAAGKRSDEPLLTNPQGKRWASHQWGKEFRAAARMANANAKPEEVIVLEDRKLKRKGASAYSFRHLFISIEVQRHGIDLRTVALQAGTSVAMIEKFYFKFIPSELQRKYAAIELDAAA